MVWYGLVWLVWLGLILDNINQKLLLKFHQDPTYFGCSGENLISVWFGLFWLGMVRFGLKQHPSEASVKVSSRSNLF